MKKNLLKPVERRKEVLLPTTIAGKPFQRFYKLPFVKGSQILTQQELEKHTHYRARKVPNLLVRKTLSFYGGLLTMAIKPKNDDWVKVYLFVEYDCLWVSCSVDTNQTYLSGYAYITLRAMMWGGSCDLRGYYWPGCFDTDSATSKCVDIVENVQGLKIIAKKAFEGLFRPGDDFPFVSKPSVMAPMPHVGDAVDSLATNIGYCFARTDLVKYHSQHNPFLVPYLFSTGADGKRLKSFERFIVAKKDLRGLMPSAQQQQLNRICFAMQKIAALAFGNSARNLATIEKLNNQHKKKLFKLWHRAWPLLMQQPVKHDYYSYGKRNLVGKPLKKQMLATAFSASVPVLSFILADKGDYFELSLCLKVKGRLLLLAKENTALFMVSTIDEPQVWYLLGSEMDCKLVWYFSRVGFKVQVIKEYYREFFEGYVVKLGKWYGVVYR